MKNLQEGFIAPPILIILALVVGGGIYWSTQYYADIQSTTTSTKEVDQTINQGSSQNQSVQNKTTDKEVDTTKKVSITDISPTSGPIGTKITIKGSGFTTTGNVIHFGLVTDTLNAMGTTYPNISSSNNIIVFEVPARDNPMCPESSPMCPIRASNPITPGAYNLLVSNSNGWSNVLVFRVQ